MMINILLKYIIIKNIADALYCRPKQIKLVHGKILNLILFTTLVLFIVTHPNITRTKLTRQLITKPNCLYNKQCKQ